MEFLFQKYQGTGNDFVIIDDRNQQFPSEDLSVIRRICHRKFGVGSDGLILIQKDETVDFKMVFYNPDGSQSYCGNGSRCAVSFAHSMKIIGEKCRFSAIDGIHNGSVEKGNWISTSILPVSKIEKFGEDVFVHTGSPHYIVFCHDVDRVDILKEAREIRYSQQFHPTGTNVNFVQVISDHVIKMRTYERGVEDETLSCGTGVTAAALTVLENQNEISVSTLGGDLKVSAVKEGQGFKDIWLKGPAELVFKGVYEL